MAWQTTTQILERLQGREDPEAWRALCTHFDPVIRGFARQLGLNAQDAEDAAQETLATLVKGLRNGRYDRTKGRLSAWLFGVARNVVLHLRSHRPREQALGTQYDDRLPDDRAMQMTWDGQWQRVLLGHGLAQVRGETDPNVFEAFRLYCLEERPVDEVAERLGMSRNAVYIAKSRVLTSLRRWEDRLEDGPEVPR